MEEKSRIHKQINKMLLSLRDLEKQINEEMKHCIYEENVNKKATIIIGPSGSGKTTLYYALVNKTIKSFRDENCIRLTSEDPDDKCKIDHNGLEEKRIGIKYDSLNGTIFCDIPGFFGNESEIQDLVNSYAIHLISKKVNCVKILLVVSLSDIISLRGLQFKKICQIIENQFKNQDELRSSIGLVITNIDPDCKKNFKFLNNVDDENGGLLKYFKDNEKNSSDVVFHFPAPKNLNEPFINEEINKIRSFVRICNKKALTYHISLSNESKLLIINGIDFFGDIRILLKSFINQMIIDIHQSDEDLNMWLEKIEKMKNCQYLTPTDFIEKNREIIIPSTSQYEDIYNRMNGIDFWQNFLKKVIFKCKDEIFNEKNYLFESVFTDISSYFKNLLCLLETNISSKILENKTGFLQKEIEDASLKIKEMLK